MEKKKLIERYLSGESTPEETAQVTAYLADDQSDFSLLQEVLNGYDTNSTETGHVQARDQLLQQLRQQLYPHLAAQMDDRVFTMHPEKRRMKWWMGAAAAMVLLLSTYGLIKYKYMSTRPENTMSWRSIENITSTVQSYHLPDGSGLWLHPHSRLIYTAAFGKATERKVWLEGEGFFDVVHDDTHPFIVQTGRIQTQVLGTAFNMEAYGDENTIRVSLVRGKVAVGDTATDKVNTTTQLSAGHVLVYDKQKQHSEIDTLSATSIEQWTDGTIVLQNMPVTAALRRVSKRFGLQLKYAENVKLEGKNVNGVFKDQTLEEMLHIILFVSGYQYRLNEQIIEIYKK